MTRLAGPWQYEAALVASLAAVSCSTLNDDAESQWRRATVVGVQLRAPLQAGVDAHCVDAVGAGPGDEVVLVKYRVGRAPYLQAFVVTSGRALHAGDSVAVHPSKCTLK